MTNMLALFGVLTTIPLTCGDDALDFQKTLPASVAWAAHGGEANLPCDVSGDKINMVLWFKDSTGIPLYSLDARGGNVRQATHWAVSGDLGARCSSSVGADGREAILTIKNVGLEDQGVYRCRVDFIDSPTKNYRVNLTLAVPPSPPVILDLSGREIAGVAGPYFEGFDIHLTCLVSGGQPRPTVRWWRDNTMLDSISETISESNVINRLFINSVSRSMFGQQLECHAQSIEGAPPIVTQVALEILLKPLYVTIQSGSEILSAEKSKQILCETTGSFPTAKISWLLDNKPIRHDAKMVADGINSTMGTLTFRPAAEDDGKELVCRAENPKFPGTAIEDRKILQVSYAPTASVFIGADIPLDQLQEGSSAQLTCEVRSNPPPDRIIWFHGNKAVEGSSSRILSFSSLTREMAGNYSCLATNKEGAGRSNPVQLQIKHAPFCRKGFETRMLGVMLQELVQARCEVEASPSDDLEFFWQFNATENNSQIARSRMTSDGLLSVLHYVPANIEDYGTLSCKASNSVGTQAQPCIFTITQIGVPESPKNCELTNSTSMGDLMLRCVAGFDGGLKQYFLLEVLETGSEPSREYLNNHLDQEDEGKRKKVISHRSPQPIYKQRKDVPQFYLNGVSFGFYDLAVYAVNSKGRSNPPVTFPGVEISAITAKLTYSDNQVERLMTMLQGMPGLYVASAVAVTFILVVLLIVVLTVHRKKTRHQRPILTTNQGIAPFEHVFIAGGTDKHGNSDSEVEDEGGGTVSSAGGG